MRVQGNEVHLCGWGGSLHHWGPAEGSGASDTSPPKQQLTRASQQTGLCSHTRGAISRDSGDTGFPRPFRGTCAHELRGPTRDAQAAQEHGSRPCWALSARSLLRNALSKPLTSVIGLINLLLSQHMIPCARCNNILIMEAFS